MLSRKFTSPISPACTAPPSAAFSGSKRRLKPNMNGVRRQNFWNQGETDMSKGIRFSDEFKQDAVAQVVERRCAVSEVAARLEISTKSQ
jgi:hypothetical protein